MFFFFHVSEYIDYKPPPTTTTWTARTTTLFDYGPSYLPGRNGNYGDRPGTGIIERPDLGTESGGALYPSHDPRISFPWAENPYEKQNDRNLHKVSSSEMDNNLISGKTVSRNNLHPAYVIFSFF